MVTLLIIIFVITYAAIAFEHPLKINKSASALSGAGLLWAVYAIASTDYAQINQELSTSLIGTAQIVFFLMAAMAIVEVVDAKLAQVAVDYLLGGFFPKLNFG